MEPQEVGLLITKGFALFLIITFAVKIGVKEALVELRNESNRE